MIPRFWFQIFFLIFFLSGCAAVVQPVVSAGTGYYTHVRISKVENKQAAEERNKAFYRDLEDFQAWVKEAKP